MNLPPCGCKTECFHALHPSLPAQRECRRIETMGYLTTDCDRMHLAEWIARQRDWSIETFGPGKRTAGVLAHLRQELQEVAAAPDDIMEWIDLVVLALDGAWRQGFTPDEITAALAAKLETNIARDWPDWRGFGEDEAIEHVRER